MTRYAVVTGASSGIGAELAKELSGRGLGVILVARREERLRELASGLGTPVEIFTADLSRRSECERLGEFLRSYNVAVFVNNAGFGDCSAFLEGDVEKEMQMIDVNVRALHLLSKIAVKQMSANGGYLLNVGSCAGLMAAGPYMATYYATKAYVVSFTQAIAEELAEAKSKVHASVLCPGPVNTEFNSVANVEFSLPGISARFCAKYAVCHMLRQDVVIVPGVLMKVGMLLGKFLPRSLYTKIAAHQQKKKLGM